MVTAIFDPKFGLLKEEIMRKIKEVGINSRPFFHPLSLQPVYAAFDSAREARGRNVVAYRVAPYGVNLPCGGDMSRVQAEYVSEVLRGLIGYE